MIVIGLLLGWLAMFVIGFWCGIVYSTGREHAQTERWENEAHKSKQTG